MATRKIFFTGYPGFIGRWQVRSILADDPDVEFIFLVQEKFMARAAEDISELEREGSAERGSLRAVVGDVTDPHLGLSAESYESLAAWATEVWHLAGAFDLFVPEGIARRINYWGVRHIVDFCKACGDLSFLVHFSSVVVHAEREGLITEDELDAGQDLINNYFMTKFWGEVEVRRAMEEGLPAIIIRPAGVMGDSRTGETDKFDNIYLTFGVLALLGKYGIPPVYLGKGTTRPNFVPIDYIVDAVTVITRNPAAVGRCFHVVDPDPPTAREMFDVIYELTAGKKARITVPTKVVDFMANKLGWMFKLLNIPPDSMTYVNHVGLFDASNTLEMLRGSGISCPRIRDYYPRLYEWWLANRDRPDMSPKM
ncbi:MAG: SDR family oxidoreductase [Actinomycetota bacterium]